MTLGLENLNKIDSIIDLIGNTPLKIFDNKLLLLFSIMAFIASFFGLVLTYYRLSPEYRHPKKLALGINVRRKNNKDAKAEVVNEEN